MKTFIGRLPQWALHLQKCTFSVLHMSGKKHQDADGFYRTPLPSIPCSDDTDEDFSGMSAFSLEALAASQESNSWVASIVQGLKNTTVISDKKLKKKSRNFLFQDRFLYKHSYKSEGPHWLLVIPQPLRPEVLKLLQTMQLLATLVFITPTLLYNGRIFGR